MTSTRPHPPDHEDRNEQRGSALIMVIMITTILLSTMSLLMVATLTQSKASTAHHVLSSALLRADNGMARAVAMICDDPAGPWDALLVDDGSPAADTMRVWTGPDVIDGAEAFVWKHKASTSTTYVYRIKVRGTVSGRSRMIEAIFSFEQQKVPVVPLHNQAAVVTLGDVFLEDKIDVLGNDHTRKGDSVGPATYDTNAIDTCGVGTITTEQDSSHDVKFSGNSNNNVSASTNAIIAARNESTTGEAGTNWYLTGAPGYVNSASGFGVGNNVPQRVGHIFGLADESDLISAAQISSTYFTQDDYPDLASLKSAYNNWVTTTGDGGSDIKIGGLIVYVEIDNTSPPDLADLKGWEMPYCKSNKNSGSAGSALLIFAGKDPLTHDLFMEDFQFGNEFHGYLVCDSLEMEDDKKFVGGMFAFNLDDTLFLDEDGEIKYSHDAQSEDYMPGIPTGAEFEALQLIWREVQNEW